MAWLDPESDSKGPWRRSPDENNRTVEPLGKGNEFVFDVKFNNLREWEPGLLPGSLELEGGLAHKPGMARAYGFGRVEILVEGLSVRNGEPAKVSEKRLIEAGFRRLGVEEQDDLKREEFRCIRQSRELPWFHPDDACADVRYPPDH